MVLCGDSGKKSEGVAETERTRSDSTQAHTQLHVLMYDCVPQSIHVRMMCLNVCVIRLRRGTSGKHQETPQLTLNSIPLTHTTSTCTQFGCTSDTQGLRIATNTPSLLRACQTSWMPSSHGNCINGTCTTRTHTNIHTHCK